MGLINDDIRGIITSSTIGFLATVMPDGKPNLSPKGSLAVWDDDSLYFADMASPRSIANIRENPYVEVNFVDVISRRGYRLKGKAEVHENGTIFEHAARVLRDTHGPQYPCNHAVLIHVTEVAEVRSPAYTFNTPAPTETSVRKAWMDRLGVQPLDARNADRSQDEQ